ncbi:hypothetical protein [Pseudomonas citronellolis]|uniref:hypothetical protein n=1 Tax=Pseudomonas citronellolis TaxID=53408 RepID=UPI0023E3CCB4|nr:hypothetical protein [Pseudomonas citronellolis]MDF3932925.1 hypothetical protein [Pseudomonas citronellolis]
MGSSSRSQTTGFRYGFDIHQGLGLPLDEICEIQASDKSAWKGSITSNGQIRINAPNLFGGDKGEGGIDGTLDVMFGDEDQVPAPKLVAMLSQLGGIVPAFRGQATAFFSGLVCSNNPYPKPWKFLRRGGERLWAPDSAWYPEKQFIWLADGQIKAMNPIHILYLIYTGKRFRGLPRARLDDTAWRAAADTAYSEGLGLCLEWKRSDTLKNFRDSVLSHVSAEIYLDRRQALLSIRLLRDDYVVSSLPLFDEDSGLLDITRDEASSNDSTSVPSIMVVKYVDAIDGKTKQVRGVNSAVAARDGGQTVQVVDYPGAPTGDIAGRLLKRDLRLATAGLKRFKIVLDRRGRNLSPGQPFRVRSVRRGIPETVVRVGRFEDGTLTDGRVQVTVLQDVFGLPLTGNIAVPPTGWLPPDREARAITTRRLIEVPYASLAGNTDPANLAQIDPTATYMAALAVAPTSLSMSYELTDRVGTTGTFVERATGDWCPSAALAGALAKEPGPSIVTLTGASRLDEVVVGMAAMVDDEVVRVDAVNYDTAVLTLARGCLDSVPAGHSSGARIWFHSGFENIDEAAYTLGVTLQAKLLTNTSQAQLDPALAGTDSLTLQGRQGRPYPPAQFKIAGQSYPASVSSTLTVSWAHRDRVAQADQVVDTTVGNIGPESGTTYSARLTRADTGDVLASSSGLSGTSVALSTTYSGNVQLELWSERGGLQALQRHAHIFNYTSGAALWTPASLTGLRLWVKADNPANTVSGSELTGLADLSGRGNAFTVYGGTVANRAKLVSGGLAGRTVWRSDSERLGSFICTATDILAASNNVSGLTAAIVHRNYPAAAAVSVGNHMFVAARNAAPTQARILLSAGFLATGARYAGGRRLDTDGNVTVNDTSNKGTAWQVMVGVNDYAGAKATLSLNGVPTVLTGFQTPGNTSATNGSQVVIGHVGDGTAQSLGDYAEVIYIQGALSDSDRQKLEGYLAWAWGLSSSLPAGHPYRTAPPAA